MSFSGPVLVEWLEDGRDMRLLCDLDYTDPTGRVWHVPRDAVVNGASIPRAFWPLIGCPYVGKYRRASVIHDHYCGTREHSPHDTHLAFLWAMMEDGVPRDKAEVMYRAVRDFGPRWDADGQPIVAHSTWVDPWDDLRYQTS